MSYDQFTNRSEQKCLVTPDFGENFDIISNLTHSVKSTRIVIAVINGVAAPPTFVFNLLIIWTVLKKEDLRSNSYTILLACLAFTDLLVGLVVQPISSLQLVCLATKCELPCLYSITFISGIICLALTMSTLMMVSVERYLAIQHPFFYRNKVNSNRVTIATAMTWITTPTVLLLSRLILEKHSVHFKKVPTLVVASIHVAIILYCTVTVQIAAYLQKQTISRQLAAVQTNQLEIDSNQENQERRVRLQEFKNAFTMGMLVLATVMCYSPIIVTVLVETVKGINVTDDYKYVAQAIASVFLNLQSLVNPVIISLRMSDIRKGVKNKLICKQNALYECPVRNQKSTLSSM